MNDQNEKLKTWSTILNPENLKGNLMFASLYVALFESFKDSIIDKIRFFYCNGFNEQGYLVTEGYKLKVLSLDKSIFKSSLLWLKEVEALDDMDIETIDQLRQYRNKLSHELITLIFDCLLDDLPSKLIELIELRTKIEKWWILNVELPTQEEISGDMEIDEDNIVTGLQVIIQVILELISDDEKGSSFYQRLLKELN